MKQSRVAIIGAGAVGAATAYAIMWKNIAAEILLVDIDEKRCIGEVYDLSDAIPFCCTSTIAHGSFKDAGQANIIIIAAGKRQKPGQDRVELLSTNRQIINSIMQEMQPIQPHAIIIMVTNPVDIMAYFAQKASKLPNNQVFGSGTYLDTQRLCGAISRTIDVAEQSIQAYILGEHGESQFVAWSCAYIAGTPLAQFPAMEKLDRANIAEEIKKKAYEIIECKDATYYGIAACVADMCESIIFNQRRVIPVSCYQQAFDVCLSIPTIIGKRGIEQMITPPLNEDEQQLLVQSATKLQEIIKAAL